MNKQMFRFVEIMAPVFSRDAWRCVWHMIQVYNILSFRFKLMQVLSFQATMKNFYLLLQNDLVHGWGLDFALRRCVEVRTNFFFFSLCLSSLLFVIVIRSSTVFFAWTQPAHEKIGVVDAQWIVHQGVPSLGNQVNPSF